MASKMEYAKGERLNIRFDRKIKLEFHGARLTSDGGLLVKLIKIGAKVLRRSRYVIFQMAEVAISKEMFSEILSRVNRLRHCLL